MHALFNRSRRLANDNPSGGTANSRRLRVNIIV